eukprot:TRINITY_DN67550_c2_g3_i1.p1 TRINITY_DN67550_c2_g3~~TRINITY_DN67550_c2_g3_i1.p1  ORF type:complete len:300 (+),score=39.57 TRINITY_DN67550_c2_g3_i1:25-900(+)
MSDPRFEEEEEEEPVVEDTDEEEEEDYIPPWFNPQKIEDAKAKGNEAFKSKDFVTAFNAYTEGINHLRETMDGSVLYSNRAAALLEMSKTASKADETAFLQKALRDAKWASKQAKEHKIRHKGVYRAAKASVMLAEAHPGKHRNLLQEAITGLQALPKTPDVTYLLNAALSLLETLGPEAEPGWKLESYSEGEYKALFEGAAFKAVAAFLQEAAKKIDAMKCSNNMEFEKRRKYAAWAAKEPEQWMRKRGNAPDYMCGRCRCPIYFENFDTVLQMQEYIRDGLCIDCQFLD